MVKNVAVFCGERWSFVTSPCKDNFWHARAGRAASPPYLGPILSHVLCLLHTLCAQISQELEFKIFWSLCHDLALFKMPSIYWGPDCWKLEKACNLRPANTLIRWTQKFYPNSKDLLDIIYRPHSSFSVLFCICLGSQLTVTTQHSWSEIKSWNLDVGLSCWDCWKSMKLHCYKSVVNFLLFSFVATIYQTPVCL